MDFWLLKDKFDILLSFDNEEEYKRTREFLFKLKEASKEERKEFERKEFGLVNLEVTKSESEVRVWACSDEGVNVFRLKAMGKVHAATINDIIVVSKKQVE